MHTREHPTRSRHVALCFLNYGPYHYARLRACVAGGARMTSIQLGRLQSEYPWKGGGTTDVFSMFEGCVEAVPHSQWLSVAAAALDRLNPDVCAVAGYSHPGLLAMSTW